VRRQLRLAARYNAHDAQRRALRRLRRARRRRHRIRRRERGQQCAAGPRRRRRCGREAEGIRRHRRQRGEPRQQRLRACVGQRFDVRARGYARRYGRCPARRCCAQPDLQSRLARLLLSRPHDPRQRQRRDRQCVLRRARDAGLRAVVGGLGASGRSACAGEQRRHYEECRERTLLEECEPVLHGVIQSLMHALLTGDALLRRACTPRVASRSRQPGQPAYGKPGAGIRPRLRRTSMRTAADISGLSPASRASHVGARSTTARLAGNCTSRCSGRHTRRSRRRRSGSRDHRAIPPVRRDAAQPPQLCARVAGRYGGRTTAAERRSGAELTVPRVVLRLPDRVRRVPACRCRWQTT
jgi:hypothetical protein